MNDPDDLNPPQPSIHDDAINFCNKVVVIWFVLFWLAVGGAVVWLML